MIDQPAGSDGASIVLWLLNPPWLLRIASLGLAQDGVDLSRRGIPAVRQHNRGIRGDFACFCKKNASLGSPNQVVFGK